MVVLQNGKKSQDINRSTIVRLTRLEKVTNNYLAKLQVNSVNKTSSVLTLSIVDPVKELGEDFLNTLILNYNKDAENDKNAVARGTEAFINKRLASITKELDTVEGEIEFFKKSNRVTDIVSEAKAFLSSATDYQKEYIRLQTYISL
jgi:uncharacterized protein involved in exopolysaccharide biosynthesis